ncbi:MAG: gamma-glutamyltransferase [Alphaproteobacteria bacterium]|nr:gamma-glutamyltransferase [Alphaproteobacteria bacterium]
MPIDGLTDSGSRESPITLRPAIAGTRHMAVAGHYLAAHAAFEVLEAGGNAIDAGCAGGIALGVLQSELVNVAGVAPIIIYLADSREVVTISGLGTWPAATDPEVFRREHDGHVPEGILRTVVPAAPDAWITALRRYGSMNFSDVAAAAIRFASEGFVMYPLMADLIRANEEKYRRWDANAAIYLPGGNPPNVGDLFVQSDLGRTLQYMADEETAAAGRGRDAGLQAAHDAFYKGDIAATIVRFHEENGGLLRAPDLANFESGIEPPVSIEYRGTRVYACGPWCQGPALPQALRLLDGFDLGAMGHNSPAYIHTLIEAIKLAFADRHHYYGDPRFVKVPMDALLSEAYAERRRELIRPDEAWPDMPPGGDPSAVAAIGPTHAGGHIPADAAQMPALDTSYVCVTDRHGNVFSATPSDTSNDAPVVPGTGLCPSSRGSQSWADPDHAASVVPGKRPRLTPNPALAIREGEFVMPFGTPGGDVQVQAMLQCFLNVVQWGMNPQQAIEAPRFATYSFPDSFEPHGNQPAKIKLESRIEETTASVLESYGHDVDMWPDWTWRAGSVCMIHKEWDTGIHTGGADARRPAYAIGW